MLCNTSQYGNVGEAVNTITGNNAFIGVNSIILMSTHIGNNGVVGPGSFVSGSFEDNVVITGNPDRLVCTIDSFF